MTCPKQDTGDAQMPLSEWLVRMTLRGEPPIELPDRREPDRKGGWMGGEIWMASDVDEAWEEILDEIERKEIG